MMLLTTFPFQQEVLDRAKRKQIKRAKKKKRKAQRKNRKERQNYSSDSSSSVSSTSGSSREYRRWAAKNRRIAADREMNLDEWKEQVWEQARAEYERKLAKDRSKREKIARNRCHRRLGRFLSKLLSVFSTDLFMLFAWAESFFGNLPLTIGAIGLSIGNLGVDWFKFTEESLSSCQPVHFHSAQCTFPEVRGQMFSTRSFLRLTNSFVFLLVPWLLLLRQVIRHLSGCRKVPLRLLMLRWNSCF